MIHTEIGMLIVQPGERASGSVVALAAERLPASVRSPVIATLVSQGLCVWAGVRVCGGVRVSQCMVRFESIWAASSVLSPVSVGVQNLT